MNPNNPLLNRLFEKKTSKNKRVNATIKDQLSNRQKILVPKLAPKNAMQLGANNLAERQKTTLIKPNLTKLPPLSQKQIGKQPIITSEKKTTFRERKVSWNTTHDIPLFATELNFSTPQLEEKQEEFFEYEKKESAKKFKTVSSEPVIQKNQEELFQYLKILQKNQQLKEQFCYMNRGELPYSYQIVDYQQLNHDQFLTVSLRGVSIYKDGQSEFTTAEKLYRQIELYRKIKKIQFFQKYILHKIINHWRFRSVRRRFEGQCRLIGKVLLSQNPILQNYYHFLFNLKEEFSKCKFMDIRISSTGNLEALQTQLKNKEQFIEKSVDYFESTIKKNLKQTIQKNLNKFRKEERVSLTSDGKEIGDEAFLPYDTKKKSMKYTQIAKLKQFEAAMYKLLKMTDMVRFTSKCEMVKDGLINFAFEMNHLHQKYVKRKSASFVSWINMKIVVFKPNKNVKSVYVCTPTIQQIEELLKNHLKQVLDKFYKKHYLLIDKKDEFFCQSYEPQSQQFPSKLQFKYFIEQNNQYKELKKNCEQKLDLCVGDIKKYLEYAEELLKIYDDSFVNKNVEAYMENDALKAYLVSQAKSRQAMGQWEQIIQFGIVYLDMSQAFTMAREKFQEKFKYISNAIPVEVAKRCETLAQKIKEIYNLFKENPSTVMEFITFMKNYLQQKKEIPDLEKKIEAILELEDMVYKNGLRIGENSKMFISQITTYFRELQKRFEQIEGNQQKERKKFYKMVDDMVEPLDLRAEELYKKIYQDQIISNSESDVTKCLEKICSHQQEFSRIKEKKQELFFYQNELKLGHKDIPNYFKLESNLQWVSKIWKGRQKYKQFLQHVQTKGYAQKSTLNIQDLKQFIRDLDLASSQVQYVELLQNFKHDAQRVFNIIEVCRMLSADTLQDQHKNTIRSKLVTKNKRIKDYLFLIQGGRSIICSDLVTETNILEIKHELEEVVHASAQESIIKKNIQQVEQFWRKTKIIIISEDIAKNGQEIQHLGVLQNQKLQQKIGAYLLTFKNILGSKHSVGQLQTRVIQQIETCEYLKNLIQKWIQVEREWIKLLPMMTNCPSIKHQSNVYFQFTALDNNIRKHNRQINDLSSLKKVVEDYAEKRYLTLMDNIERDLREVNKTFATFLEIKRNTYYRFFFLADQELINILENTKDAKSLAKYAGYCFNCDRLLLERELVSGFETPTEMFKLRKGILKGQPDQMFKSVEQNMKTSLKFSIMSLIPKMKIGMNIEQEHENCLQAVLVADRFLWTQMTQLYLNPSSYDSYQLFLRRPCQQLMKFTKKTDITADYRHKISVRLVQAMGLREIGEEMVKLQITKDDFKWKQQRKYTIEQEQIVITQFNRKFIYGLEYYPPSKITVPTQNYKMLLSQVYETSLSGKVLIVTGVEGDGKRNLMLSSAKEYGYFYKELVCNKNISVQYILRFVQGAVLAGAWLSFYQFQHLEAKVLVKLLNEIKKIVMKIKKNQQGGETPEVSLTVSGNVQRVISGQTPILKVPFSSFPGPLSQKTLIRTSNGVMFNFITHGFYPEKVSVYQFDSFALSEPNHKKICEWLLQVNNFTDWEHISSRLVGFLQTIFPFLQRVMGSFMSILRKVIDTAVFKKKHCSHRHKQTDIIAETFKQQILQKSDENIHHILNEALHTYFFYEIPEEFTARNHTPETKKSRLARRKSLSIDSKLSVLCSLLNKKVKNILVIGPRTNKSKLIRQAGQALQRQILSIYPQASEYFFHDQTIEKLNKLDEKQIIHYDGQSIMRQWNDLVISEYLLIEGKKIHLNNQLIIELREVSNCSPSFVGSCQIVYIGHLVSKRERFGMLSGAGQCEYIMEPICQIFGELLENLPENLVEMFALFLKPFTKEARSKNYHKLIAWFGNVLGIDGLWNRFYTGRYSDYTVSKYSQQLSLIDESKYLAIQQKSYKDNLSRTTFTMGNLLIQTKSTILYYELYRNLLQIGVPVLLTGKFDTGKSTLIKLLLSNLAYFSQANSPRLIKAQSSTSLNKQEETIQVSSIGQKQEVNIDDSQLSTELSKIILPIVQKTKQWTKTLKNSLTNIRRDGKNFLMNVGDNDIIIAVDDLDLGFESHREYLRQLIDLKTLHDARFEEYAIAKAQIVAVWHKEFIKQAGSNSGAIPAAYKLFDRTIELQIPQFTKQSLSTIIRTNIDHFTKKNNMSKEVISIIDTYLVKALLIAFDDITNISGQNCAASIVLAAMRNLLSLPKKNVLMSADNYIAYFKMQLKARMFQKCFTSKSVWQYNNAYDNLNKVIFSSLGPKPAANSSSHQSQPQQEETTLLFSQQKFTQTQLSKLKQKIVQSFPHLYIFDQMLKVIVLLNNQLQMLDSNCILVGRSGTGKVTILKVVASLSKMHIYDNKYDLSQCIVRCLRGQSVILLESYLRRDFGKLLYNSARTLYQKIQDCVIDEDLEKLITVQQMKKEFRTLVAEIPHRQGPQNDTKVLKRVLANLKSVIIFDTLIKYKEASNRIRDLSRYFVCYIDEWPAEALLNISGVNIPKSQIDQIQVQTKGDKQKDKQKSIGQLDLPKILAQVFTATNRTMLNFDEPSISIKKFKFYLNIFETMYKIRNKQLSEKVEFYTKVYSKFYDACNLITEWQRRVDILKIQLEDSIKKLDQELKGNRTESFTFSVLHSLKQAEEQKIADKNEQMAGIKRTMEKQLQGMKKTMENISKIVGSMQRTEMSELKKIYKSSEIVSFGLECLCILLGQQPIQKSINKILADPNLMMKMKSQAILETRNARVIQKFKKEGENIKSQYENKSKYEASRVLIDWIKAIMQYWTILGEHQSLNGTYKQHKLEYDTSLKKQTEIEASMEDLKEKMMKLNKNYSDLFMKKEENTREYSMISVKIRNAKQLLPALKKSEEQTWDVIKELRTNLSSLVGNTILAVVCLVYLPLKRLKLKKQVLDDVKKLLNSKMVEFSMDFMSLISRTQDAVVQDLNLVAMRELEQFPVLIVDPERRALSYLFDHDPHLASSVSNSNFSEITNSVDIMTEITKHKNQKEEEQLEKPQENKLKQIKSQTIEMEESQVYIPQKDQAQHHQDLQNSKYIRKNPILHTTQQNYKPILDKLPENTFVVDWKFTTINTNEKIFLKIAANKKPQYFEAKKELNRKIKQALQKIEEYKREIYEIICQKQIKILDDQQFVELGTKLLALEVETQKNKQTEKQKIAEINQYAKQINEEVNKVIFMINALKKIKNVALDLILDIACSNSNTLDNIMKWVLATLEPKQRYGWLLAVMFDYVGENNEELFAILIKDTPLKISEATRGKKPINISNKNYENICKISAYTPNLKIFSETVLRYVKEFEAWTLDPLSQEIPSLFKPQILTILQELVLIKIFKTKILLSRVKKHIKSTLNLQKIAGYNNKELLVKTSRKFPIFAHCSLEHIKHLCSQLNNSKIAVKSLVEITDALELKRYIWGQMSEGNWLVLHSVYDRNTREVLQDIVEYVANYQEQENFRLFFYIDQVELGGYQKVQQITTKYNNLSGLVSDSKKSTKTVELELISQSKYIQNIGVSLYEELPSFRKSLMETISEFNIEIPEVSVQMAQNNPSASSFLVPQTPGSGKMVSSQKPITPLNNAIANLIPSMLNSALGLSGPQKQRFYFEKIVVFATICQIAAWMKFSKLRLSKLKGKLFEIIRYIKEYNVPMQFNIHTLASYIGRMYSSPLDSPERSDVQQLMDRIFDETKINDKQLYGIPLYKQSIALALAGIGRGGVEIDKNWIDEKVRNNYQLLGCEESYLARMNADLIENAFNMLAEIRFLGKSVKEEVSDIRLALARLPTSPIIFNRETKNTIFLHCYQNEQKVHNFNLNAAKQFLEWVNVSSNQDFKEDEIIIKQSNEPGSNANAVDVFTWDNLLRKVRVLVGDDVPQHKIRVYLANWLQNVKRKHQFLLYWNLDNPVLVLQPVLLVNFPMIVSAYIITYLSTHYTKIKQQAQSTNQNILYSLQIQFSRQTDQKELYMSEGILLPQLIYKQFRYNFEFKMLDGVLQWNGEQNASLIMLKMKKIPTGADPNKLQKDNEDYSSPPIEIGTRVNNKIEVVYKIDTYIDGNFQEWALRRPMLISQ